jgi:dimethylamine--corrinoid protein Co-methyltransferase
MNGVRTAGDMVMRLQLSKKMKIGEAKRYIAEKLGLTLQDLSDVMTMTEVRAERGFGLGSIESSADRNIGMAAKFKISEALGIRINSVEKFKELAGIKP